MPEGRDCSCGSGLSRRDMTDDRNIFCTFA